MPSTSEPSWQTPEQLAREMGRSTRWVTNHMLSGDIPSIKIGGQRYFTPECRALLIQRQLSDEHALDRSTRPQQELAAEAWGRPTRRRRHA